MYDVSIIIPFHERIGSIRLILGKLFEQVNDNKISVEVLIVDSGSVPSHMFDFLECFKENEKV